MLRLGPGIRPPQAVGDAYRGIDEALKRSELRPSYLRLTRKALGVTPSKKKVEPVKKPKKDVFKITSDALGQFVRAFLKAKGRLRRYIDDRLKERFGERKLAKMCYSKKKQRRDLERLALVEQMSLLIKTEGKILRQDENEADESVTIYHIQRGPKGSFFALYDTVTRRIFGFLGAKRFFKRRKANRWSRRKAHLTDVSRPRY